MPDREEALGGASGVQDRLGVSAVLFAPREADPDVADGVLHRDAHDAVGEEEVVPEDQRRGEVFVGRDRGREAQRRRKPVVDLDRRKVAGRVQLEAENRVVAPDVPAAVGREKHRGVVAAAARRDAADGHVAGAVGDAEDVVRL